MIALASYVDARLFADRKTEQGGLSGLPLLPLSLHALRTLRSHLPPSIPLIGCGGISSGQDALLYARAGASTVQLYTSFGYGGVGVCRRIKEEITDILRAEGTTWAEVVEKAVRELSEKPNDDRSAAKEKKSEGAGDSTLQTLIAEALEIGRRLDLLGQSAEGEGSVAAFKLNSLIESASTGVSQPWAVP